jgi:hypothetical protein
MITIASAARRVWLGVALVAVGMVTSGCGVAYQVTLKTSEASTRSYQQKTAEYQRQAKELDGQWKGIVATQGAVEARIAAHTKAVQEEKQLAEQNAALRRRIAEVEQEIGRREAAAVAAEAKREPRPLGELGKHLPEGAHASAIQEAKAYEELKGQYTRQLQALVSQPNGSPARRREGEMVRARAVLEVIAEAIALANVPRAALRDPGLGEDPGAQWALAVLAEEQDGLLAALQEFALRTGNRAYDEAEASRYRDVDDRVSGLLEFARGSLASVRARGDADTRLRPLVVRLEALVAVGEEAEDAATRLAIAMKGGDAPKPRPAVTGQPALGERLLRLLAEPSAAAGTRNEAAHRAGPGLGRAPWIAAMAAYTQSAAFDAEAYLRMRLEELRRLQGAVGEVLASRARSR